MTIPTIETDEQFFSLHLAVGLSYWIGRRELWPLTGEYPGGWGRVFECFYQAENEWKANGRYCPEGERVSVFGRYKLLEDQKMVGPLAFRGLADRFSGGMSENEIFAEAQTIVHGWLAKA